MPQLPAQQPKVTWWQRVAIKAQRAYLAFCTPANLPINIVQLSDGLLVDLKTSRLVITGDLNLHTTGTMRLSSDKHVVVESGGGQDERGEVQGIWFNPILDEHGLPIQIAEELEGKVIDGTKH